MPKMLVENLSLGHTDLESRSNCPLQLLASFSLEN